MSSPSSHLVLSLHVIATIKYSWSRGICKTMQLTSGSNQARTQDFGFLGHYLLPFTVLSFVIKKKALPEEIKSII